MIRADEKELVKSLVVNQALTRLAQLESCGIAQGETTAHETWAGMHPHPAMEWVFMQEIEDILKEEFDFCQVCGSLRFFLRVK